MERFKHQQGVLQFGAGKLAQFTVRQQRNQSFDIVTTVHIAQQFNGFGSVNQGAGGVASGNGREENGFDVGGLVNTGRYTGADKIQQKFFFARGRLV